MPVPTQIIASTTLNKRKNLCDKIGKNIGESSHEQMMQQFWNVCHIDTFSGVAFLRTKKVRAQGRRQVLLDKTPSAGTFLQNLSKYLLQFSDTNWSSCGKPTFLELALQHRLNT